MADAAAGSGEEQRAARLVIVVDRHSSTLALSREMDFQVRRTTNAISRKQARPLPRCSSFAASELHAIMQSVGPILPKLHFERHDPETRPVRRARDGADRKP